MNIQPSFKTISRCRLCHSIHLVEILDFGEQYLSGIFPRTAEVAADLTKGPLQLVKCLSGGDDSCGLVQLRHSYDPGDMYGDNYGYRSGLNISMAGFLVVWLAHRANFRLTTHSWRIAFALECGVIAVAFGFVFIFLRPVSQFIYFQF